MHLNSNKKANVYLCDMGSGSNMNLLPLAIGMVGSYAKTNLEINEYFNIEYRYLRQSGQQLVSSMESPAIVGFSCYVWNFRGTLAAAKAVKEAYPKALVVLGGFSIPKLKDRIANFFTTNPFIDVLVHGEGELTFANFLKEYMLEKNFQKVQGLTYRIQDVPDGFISDPRANRVMSVDDIPSPFLNGMFDDIMKKYGSHITGALWETNRGCPYSCTFCDWGNSDVNKVNKYNLPRLYDEIKWISENGFYYMFFSDANFGIFGDRDLEIAGYIADFHQKNGSPHHVVTNWAKNKGEQVVAIAEKLARGGVASNITMAIQSTNEATLKAIKRKNLEKGRIDHLKSLFHDRHIPTYVEVILGLPLETYESFSKGLNTILSNRLDDRFFVYLCQMLENTELASPESREEYKLDTRLCRHTISNRKFSWDDEYTEYEEFVVGNSTMPNPDWVRSYVIGYFLTVLYNHRAAVFIFMYLKTEFNILPVDFLEFIISELRNTPDQYPVLSKSIQHIDKQAQLMTDGVSSMSDLPEADGLVVLPHVGSLVLLTQNTDGFYNELTRLVLSYCGSHHISINPIIFEEVILYQKIRFPGWPLRMCASYFFKTNIPEYFQKLVDGLEAPKIVQASMAVTVKDHERDAKSFADFAATLVRGGLTVDLLDIELPQYREQEDKHMLHELRKQMEQRNIDKLKTEFVKVKKVSNAPISRT